MISIEYIRNNKEEVQKGIANKGSDILVDDVLRLDEKYKELLQKLENIRASRNVLSDKISQCTKEERGELLKQAEKLKEDLQIKEYNLKQKKEKLDSLLGKMPNVPDSDVPIGKDEDDNVVLREFKNKPEFNFDIRDHLDLLKMKDMVDMERASKVSGARFGYIKNQAVILEFALVNFAFDELLQEQFTPIIPPVLINKSSMKGLGYLEKDGDEVYNIEKDDLYLVATAEHSIVPMFSDEVLAKEDLPRRFAGFSSAFRRESGSYGKDTKGIFRVHQFDKIEMVSFSTPDKSNFEHLLMLEIQERLMQKLDIPYRVVSVCTGDMGFVAKNQYDIEAWIPSQNKYRETHSTSNTGSFQSRRLRIRYKDGDKNEFVHIMNGTAFAIGRMLIAILENYQNADGSIGIPDVLQKYTGFDVIS